MRVLWFPGNGAFYTNTNKYNGGGWTGALAREILHRCSDVNLAMAIPWKGEMKTCKDGVVFYGIPNIRRQFLWGFARKKELYRNSLIKIVEDFQPDVIHVFGSEHTGGLVATVTNIPVVVHLQGILNFCYEAWLPANMSWGKMFFYHPEWILFRKSLCRSMAMETEILRACRHHFGRTEMDKEVSLLYAPERKYHYCSEMLRPEIYFSKETWKPHEKGDKKRIVSIISSPLYKGGDVLLRAAKLLKYNAGLDFTWNVYGVNSMNDWERLTGIKAHEVNVEIGGIIDAKGLISIICDSDVYVHPSYIENSPNTVCEAQVLGIPVISTHVGGISSLISHEETGLLVPANDPHTIVAYIRRVCNDVDLSIRLSVAGRKAALKRHNPEDIVKDVINTYKEMIGAE